jgi:prophage DNA circulation protein
VLKLHAAITMHLTETARPLPRMIAFQFNMTMPSVVLAQRLYADASRADELRAENKIVHPAFCPRQGLALSA